MVNRRGFLKLLGAAGAALVAAPVLTETTPKLVTPAPSAPLFVPSERLDFGVPSRRLIVPEPLSVNYLIGLDEGLRPAVMPRSGRDLEWERGIERFLKSIGATEYRIDGMGGAGTAPLLTAEAHSRLYLPDEIVIASDEVSYTLRDVIEGRA